jgi:heme oxygenase (biliverdin-IX-beta and delta-forming)
MHRHSGFAAVAAGSISRDSYRQLLARAYGFYRPLEECTQRAPCVSVRIEEDLLKLGRSRAEIASLPCCATIPPFAAAAEILGARYVLEGSALGGLVLSQAIAPLVGQGSLQGRRFFGGLGSGTKMAWRSFLLELEAALQGEAQIDAAARAALATFEAFESWMRHWETDA